MNQHRYAEAEPLWAQCAEFLKDSSVEALFARGMVWYNRAPDGGEHGPAVEYRNALRAFGQAVLQQLHRGGEPDQLILWYLGDTAAKLGTGFSRGKRLRLGHIAEHRIWRRCALQCYARVMASIGRQEPSAQGWQGAIFDGFAYRFMLLYQYHGRFGMDTGDLRLLYDGPLNLSRPTEFGRQLQEVLAYAKQSNATPAQTAAACVQGVRWIQDLAATIRDALAACDGTIRPVMLGDDVVYMWAWRLLDLTPATPSDKQKLEQLSEDMLNAIEGAKLLGRMFPPMVYIMELAPIEVEPECENYRQFMLQEMRQAVEM